MVETITLYPAPTTEADADAIAGWLAERVDAEVRVRERFLSLYGDDGLAEEFADARVLSPYDRETGNTMLGVVRYEERALDDPARAGGVIYDGLAVQRLLGDRIPDD
jgi:hypothetical protein